MIKIAKIIDPYVRKDIHIPEYGHLWSEEEETEIKKYIEGSSGFLKENHKDQISFRKKISRAINSQNWKDKKLTRAIQDLTYVAKKTFALFMMHIRLNGLEDWLNYKK